MTTSKQLNGILWYCNSDFITSDYNLIGKHNGTIHVENGTLTISGELHGTLGVQCSAKVIINGKQNGTIPLETDALVIVH